jgi:hypothetical protein
MEPAIHTKGRAVKHDGIQGGIFPKTSGGEVAVLWSTTKGSRTMFIESENPQLEHVSMLGQTRMITGQKQGDVYRHTLVLDETPCYLHAKEPLKRFSPSPVQSQDVQTVSPGRRQIHLTVKNVFPKPWQGNVAFQAKERWTITPAERKFTLQPSESKKLTFACTMASDVPRGLHVQPFSVRLPDGSLYLSAVSIPVIPLFPIPRLPKDCTAAGLQAWQPTGGPLLLDKMSQVTIGRQSSLASLKEKNAWAGPKELSAEGKIGYDDSGLLVYVNVHDAHPRLPDNWPGVLGSCVEVFFDFRPVDDGLGKPHYDRDVHQIVVRPVLQPGQKPAVWHASTASAKLPNLSVEAGRIDKQTYWILLRIPKADIANIAKTWSLGRKFGFDIGVNGPYATGRGRKSQIMLFGGVNNCSNASEFGVGRIER